VGTNFRQALDAKAIEIAKTRAPGNIGDLLTTKLPNQEEFQLLHIGIQAMPETLAAKVNEAEPSQVRQFKQ
jgi:hypothetical protein